MCIGFVFSSPEKDYKEIANKESYLESFGVIYEYGIPKYRDDSSKEMVELAYKRACENRDFEINKFWTRSTFFWGFIALIFGAYFILRDDNELYKLLTICLGLIFSFGWHFANIGSKHWQENWEMHIDILEDIITGPIYKTIFYQGTFYSVSKITQVLSLSILITWGFLLIFHLYDNGNIPFTKFASDVINWPVLIILGVTSILILTIVSGYCKKSYDTKKDKFIRRKSID